MAIPKTLKAELVKVNAEIQRIEGELAKVTDVKNSILDRMFEADTGFRVGGDAIYTPGHGTLRKPRRVKILYRTSFDWERDWWCKVQIYKKDGTLGKQQAQVFSVKNELTHPED